MDFKINKEIQTQKYTFKVGDVITTYDKSHYFSISTTDGINQRITIPYIFGVTCGKNGLEVKQKDIPRARIECSEFINKYLK
jgi:hypothetical protein